MLGTRIKKTKPNKEVYKRLGLRTIINKYVKCGAWEVVQCQSTSGLFFVYVYLFYKPIHVVSSSYPLTDKLWQEAMEYVEQRKNELITLTS